MLARSGVVAAVSRVHASSFSSSSSITHYTLIALLFTSLSSSSFPDDSNDPRSFHRPSSQIRRFTCNKEKIQSISQLTSILPPFSILCKTRKSKTKTETKAPNKTHQLIELRPLNPQSLLLLPLLKQKAKNKTKDTQFVKHTLYLSIFSSQWKDLRSSTASFFFFPIFCLLLLHCHASQSFSYVGLSSRRP